ncbi:MAG: GntR family transcriptional regulator [Thermoanaerobacteraceae bacterium]|nr:GntR family transcriptional regulator [Thermoanaerobacteraceae bacterium]
MSYIIYGIPKEYKMNLIERVRTLCPLINPNTSRSITKKQLAYNAIKEEILNNNLPSGTFLVERELCKALDISRTPIREALHQLASEGLVEFIPNRGAFVTGLTYEDIIETYDVREVLEGLATKMFTIHATEPELDELENIYNQMEKALENGNVEELVKYDVKFHRCIIKGCRNDKLKTLIKNINDHVERITNTIKKDQARAITTATHHKNIVNAIIQKDPELAERKMREHIVDSKNYHTKRYNFTK